MDQSAKKKVPKKLDLPKELEQKFKREPILITKQREKIKASIAHETTVEIKKVKELPEVDTPSFLIPSILFGAITTLGLSLVIPRSKKWLWPIKILAGGGTAVISSAYQKITSTEKELTDFVVAQTRTSDKAVVCDAANKICYVLKSAKPIKTGIFKVIGPLAKQL